MICKPQRSCGYVADLSFYYWREAGKKQMFIKGSLCQAFSRCRWEKNASEQWNNQQVKKVRESACKHLFKYLNLLTILPTSWKTVSCVTCIWGTLYSKCLLHSAGRSQMIGICVEENCHNNCDSFLQLLTNHGAYQKLVYLNEVLKTMLAGSTRPFLTSFHTFLYNLSLPVFSTILEPKKG